VKKSEYLQDNDVTDFVQWMKQELAAESARAHGYVRQRGGELQFRNLADAFAKYDWPFRFEGFDGRRYAGRTFQENATVLAGLQQRLRSALTNGGAKARDEAVCNAAIEVMRWGGVAPNNDKWLRLNEAGLAETLQDVCARLARSDDAIQFSESLRFNAGMTKVYSLLIDRFIIYDSRVAAALAWFVVAWARKRNLASIPELLQFRCMPAKEAPNAVRRKLRNPSTEGLKFPPLHNNPHAHVKWNLRASWILEALLVESPANPFGTGPAASRKLEAALFMWGYDLTPAS
jgi:hypothetical protein